MSLAKDYIYEEAHTFMVSVERGSRFVAQPDNRFLKVTEWKATVREYEPASPWAMLGPRSRLNLETTCASLISAELAIRAALAKYLTLAKDVEALP